MYIEGWPQRLCLSWNGFGVPAHLLRASLEQRGGVKATACAKFLEDPRFGAVQALKGSPPPAGDRFGGPG